MKNKQLIAVTAGACLAMFGQLAIAKGPNYTYAEIGYTNIDGDFVEGDGASVNISYGATDLIFVKLGFSTLSIEDPTSTAEADADRFQVGLGAHFALTDNIDALAAVSYVDVEFTNTGGMGSSGDDGYLAEAGVRAMVTKKVELNATVSSLHIGGDDDTGFGAGGVVNLKKRWSATGSYRYFEDDDEGEFFVGIRYRL
jgi:hypothetical protein